MKKSFVTLTSLGLLLVGFTLPVVVFAEEGQTSTTTDVTSTSSTLSSSVDASSIPSSSVLDSSIEPSSSVTDVIDASSSFEDSSSDVSSDIVESSTDSTATVPALGSQDTQTESASGATVTIYRLYNPQNGEHLYTTDANEKDVLYKKHGWGYEGEGWYAPTQGQAVYRLYNAGLQNHLYTTDTNEVRVLTTQYGWTKDNNGKPVFYSGGNSNIYRVYNKKLRGLHHWTTDSNEYNVLPQHGWSQEGIKLKAVKIGVPIKTQYYENLPSGSSTITNTTSRMTIEADVTLDGSGTGYHAKLLIVSPVSAVSFGLQYDAAARAPHTGKTSFMVENIRSNNAGGQTYDWTNYYARKGNTYHLMLILENDGRFAGYINGARVITGQNTELAGRTDLALRVEGAARKTGDRINASFSNIKLKYNGVYNASKNWVATPRFNINNGITTKLNGQTVANTASSDRAATTVNFSGTLTGLPASADWDTAGYFDKVSGLVQFY